MRSAIVLTEEIDDIDLAVEELTSGVREKLGELDRASAGMIWCDADTDIEALSGRLHEELGIDIIGLTATALIDRELGYCGCSIALLVMTGDDVCFSAGSTGPLDAGNMHGEITSAYVRARDHLGCDPKLILVCAPFIRDVTSEGYIEILDEASSHVPLFGGVASDSYDLRYQKTFFNGEASADSLRFLLIGGEVSPVFAMQHNFSGGIERKGTITKSDENVVQMVDGITFKDFLLKITSIPDEEELAFHFQSSPFVVELPDYDTDEQPVVRTLFSIDKSTGAGTFLSKMPEGSRISISVFQRDDIRISSSKTVDALIDQMKEDGRPRSVMLIVTCCGRHALMGDEKGTEISVVREKLDEIGSHLCSMGFYAFGEYCPTKCGADCATNRYHNISFAVCAF